MMNIIIKLFFEKYKEVIKLEKNIIRSRYSFLECIANGHMNLTEMKKKINEKIYKSKIIYNIDQSQKQIFLSYDDFIYTYQIKIDDIKKKTDKFIDITIIRNEINMNNIKAYDKHNNNITFKKWDNETKIYIKNNIILSNKKDPDYFFIKTTDDKVLISFFPINNNKSNVNTANFLSFNADINGDIPMYINKVEKITNEELNVESLIRFYFNYNGNEEYVDFYNYNINDYSIIALRVNFHKNPYWAPQFSYDEFDNYYYDHIIIPLDNKQTKISYVTLYNFLKFSNRSRILNRHNFKINKLTNIHGYLYEIEIN